MKAMVLCCKRNIQWRKPNSSCGFLRYMLYMVFYIHFLPPGWFPPWILLLQSWLGVCLALKLQTSSKPLGVSQVNIMIRMQVYASGPSTCTQGNKHSTMWHADWIINAVKAWIFNKSIKAAKGIRSYLDNMKKYAEQVTKERELEMN